MASHSTSMGDMMSPVITNSPLRMPNGLFLRLSLVRHEFHERLALLGDDDGFARARNLVHQRETFGFEFRGLDDL